MFRPGDAAVPTATFFALLLAHTYILELAGHVCACHGSHPPGLLAHTHALVPALLSPVPVPAAKPLFDEERWQTLLTAVTAILDETPFSSTLEALYKSVEHMCTHGMAGGIYARLRDCIKGHQQRVHDRLLEENTPNHTAALNHMDRAWQKLCYQTTFIRSIFLYLDRTYVLQTAGLLSIWDLSLSLFKEHVLRSKVIHDRTVQGLLAVIAKERAGDVIDRGMIKRLMRMLSELGLYVDSFEVPFINQSRQFYDEEGAAKIRDLEVGCCRLVLPVRLRLHADKGSPSALPLISGECVWGGGGAGNRRPQCGRAPAVSK